MKSLKTEFECNSLVTKIINIVNNIDEELVCLILENNNFDCYKKLVENNKTIPNVNHLETICKCANPKTTFDIDMLTYILDKKVIPTHKCIENLISYFFFV